MIAQYLVKTRKIGTYRNPFKPGGTGIKYGPWKTVARLQAQDLAQIAADKFPAQGQEQIAVFHQGRLEYTRQNRQNQPKQPKQPPLDQLTGNCNKCGKEFLTTIPGGDCPISGCNGRIIPNLKIIKRKKT